MKKEIKLTERQRKFKAKMDEYFEYMNEPKKPFDEIKDQDVAGFTMYKEHLEKAKAMTSNPKWRESLERFDAIIWLGSDCYSSISRILQLTKKHG